ncbi:hypothetical protein [Synergistes jonesii]|uniref:LPD3 domain-containing protein n=1 Tax=Synergistes jonesii TaxID=2754 RepID=UPI00248DFC4E|nr:hypothetical protein [Synergistes jonesii]
MFDDAMERDVFSGVKVGPALSEAEAKARGLSADSLGLKLEEVYTKYAAEDPEAHARRVWTAEAVGVPQWIQERDEMYAKEAERRLALLTKGMPDWRGLSEKYPLTARFFEDEDVMASANDDVEALAAKEGEARRAGAVAKALRGKLSRGGAGRMAAAAAMRNMPKIYREEPEGGLSLGARWALGARRAEAGREKYSQRMPISDEVGRAALSAAAKDLSFVNDFLSGSPFGKGASAGYEMSSIGSEADDLFAAEALFGRRDEARWVALEKRLLALDREKPEGWFSGLLYETGKFYGQQARGAWTTGAMGATGAVLGAYAASLGAALPGATSFAMTSGALAGAGAAAMVGAAPVLPAVAAAVFTAAAGWWLGTKLGVFTQAAKTEAGLDLIERRMMTDEEGNHLSNLSVGLGSMAVGAVNGALELFEWETAGRPFLSVARRAVPKAALSSVSAAVARRLADLPAAAKIAGLAAKEWGMNVFTESMTEVMQDLVPITIDEMQKYALLDGYDMRTLGEVNAQLRETFVSSLYSFSLISALGPAGGFANRGARYRVELARRELEAAETMRLNRTLDSFAERLFATKLLKRFPGMSREHTQRILEGADLSRAYMSASAVEMLFQEARKDEGSAAADYESAKEWAVEVLGVDEEDYDRSLDEGYKMELAAAKVFEAAGDGDVVMEALGRELSWIRDGMTLSEAEEAKKNIDELRRQDFFKLKPIFDTEELEERSARKLYEAARMQFEEEGVDAETAAAWAWTKSRVYIPLARMYSDAMPKEAAKAAKRGGRELGRFLPEDVERMFPMVIERGEDGKPKGLAFNQPAWHGSPYKFDKFSLEHIGEGEGAQAFGWGLYFAGEKDVARFYRERLTQLNGNSIDDVKYEGRTALEWHSYWEERAAKGGKDAQKYYDRMSMLEDYDVGKDPADIISEAKEMDMSSDAIEWFDKTIAQSKERPGALYKVDIPDDGGYLLWDEKVSEEQERLLLDALSEVDAFDGPVSEWIRRERMNDSSVTDYISEEEIADEYYPSDVLREHVETYTDFYEASGEYVYHQLEDIFGSPKAASKFLKDAGFAGIKYLDGSSRRRGEGNYNYVIFDAAAVNILETYYQALNENTSEEFKKALPDRVFDSFDGAKEYLRKQLEGTKKGIANESNNILVSLGMNGVKKMLSGKAAEKSLANGFTTRDHITAAANIVKLYRNSELLFEHPDKKERRGVTKIKRFGAPVMLPDAEEASVAYITVREIYGKDNKLYSVELMSFELLKAKEMPSGNLGAGSAEYSEAVSPQTEGISRLSEKLEAVNADYAKFEQKTRGSIAFPAYDGGPVRITLGKGADHSTFVHELAHLYLWHLKRLAALDVTFNSAAFTGPYTASWNNDLKAVFGWWDDNAESIARQAAEFASKEGKDELSADGFRRWLASGMETGSEAGRAYDRAAQEYFARGFEAYLAEGRAPSKELLSVFRRFKQWLCDIYKSLTELDVELSDDIREVFDRMLATEEAVERLKAEREIDAAMAALPGGDAESMGAPPDFGDDPYEAAKEYMLSDLLEKRTPERRKAMADRAEEIRPEITRAVAEEAGFRAISVMEENPEMRLSADAVLDEFGENVVSAMPEGTLAEKPGEGMTDLTVAAKALGFASAKDMIDAVAGRGSVSSEIDARVRAAVEAEFADEASSPEAMDAAAEAALYETDDTGERIAAEAEVDFAAASEEVRAAEESEAAEETEAEAEPEFADDEEARAYHEAFRDIFEADEAAKAEREYPRSRKNVMAWIRANGGFSYRAVEAAIGREQARELIKKTGPGLFKKDAALGLDTAAQALSSMGVSFESDEALLKVLMKDPAALSPIELAAAEARKETIREFKAEYKALRDKLRSEAQEEKKEGREKLSALRKKLKARYEERTENLRDKYQKMTERQRAEFDERKQRERERKNAARMKRALEKQTEKSVNKKETAGAARLATRNTVTAMTVQRLYDVSGWVKVEKESRAEADKALRARDEERYKGAKRKELYAHEMVRAMYKARGRAEYIRKKLAEYQGRGQKRTFGMTPEYLRQMDAMLSRLDLERRKNKDKLALKPEDMTEQAKPLDEFIREQAEDGTPLLVPKWMLSAAESRKYESLRMDELEEVYKAAQNMMQAGRDENKTIALAKNVELAGIDVQVLARAQGYYGKKKVHGKTVIEVAKEDPKLAADFIADLDTAEAMCRALDGYEDFGPMQDFVFRPIREAVSREYAELNRVFGLFRDLKLKVYGGDFRADMKKRDIGVPEYRRETDEKTGKPYYVQTGRMSLFTQENIICAAFNMGNADNIARLKDGWGWTDKDIERIKDQLTEKDWRYVQGVWDLLEEMWPQIRKVHELLTGTTIEKVEAQKLRTKFGELRGGYYPIVTDLRYSESAASQSERQEVMATAPLDHAQRFAKNGHRKARAENVLGRPPMLSFAVLDNHVANVIHDYELSPAVRDARKILRRDAVRSVIKSVLGERGLRNFNHWLNDVAANTKNNGVARGSGDRFVQGLKSNTAMFALGANLGGALMQPLGYFPLAHRIGFVNAAMAVMSWLANPQETYDFAREHSAFMREQLDNGNSEVRKLRQNWTTNDHGISKAADMMLSIYPFMQNMCNAPGWVQCYKMGLAKYGTEEKAVAYADSVIRQTQSASTIADLSTFERSGTIGQMTTMFYSWFRVMYQMQNEAIRKVKYEHGLFNKTKDLASYTLYVLIAQSIAEALLRGSGPDAEDDDPMWAWVKWTAGRLLLAPLSTVPVARELGNFVDADFKFGVKLSPVQSALDSVGRAVMVAYKQGGRAMSGEDVEWGKAAEAAATLAGYRFGVPNRAMIRAAEAFLRYFNEDESIPWLYLTLGGGWSEKKK